MKTLQWYRDVKIGDIVSYHDVNLWQSRGTITRLGHGPNGGNCWVKWGWSNSEAEEVLEYLIAWR